MRVIYSKWFKENQLDNLRQGFKLKIVDFMAAAATNSLAKLPGRNKKSNDANTENTNFVKLAEYANEYNLWHYHLGIPNYSKSKDGDLTSNWVLHYRYVNKETIEIVYVGDHNPFSLPTKSMMDITEAFLKNYK